MRTSISSARIATSAVLLSILFHRGSILADGCPVPSFAAARTFAAGQGPESVAVGDFNGDGNPDLALANEGSANVSVLLGNGDGTFQVTVNYGAAMNPNSVAVGDFNGDGKSDLVVAYSGSANVSVLLGTGTGTFEAAV